MPIRTCVFCGRMRMTPLWVQVCDECWKAEPDPYGRMDRVIEEKGLAAPPGSLVYRPEKRR